MIENATSRVIAVDDPATGRVIGTVRNHTSDEVAEAVRLAREVQPAWQGLGLRGRAAVLRRCQRWFVDNSGRLRDSITAENGKTHDDAEVEVAYCTAAFGFWATHAEQFLRPERVRSFSPFVVGRDLFVRYEPVGVVGVIGPWNNPLMNSFGDAIPALAAGNAVVLKPSEQTPLTALLTEDVLRRCGVPEGVYRVVTGDGETGAALVDTVDSVMFTGSTRTGRKVAERAASRLIPASLELGGKDPMIVLEGADLERAANVAVYGALHNTGQTCISVERLFVQDSIHDQFVAKVADRFGRIRQGRSRGFGQFDVGAMTFPPQLDLVEAHVRDAVGQGARVLVGGEAHRDGGRFFEPTILVDVDPSMRCMREETFGPVLPIMRVHDADEAVRLANETPYGLQASIFAGSTAEGLRIGRQLEAGVVTVNDALINYMALELPMGGWKESGLGVRHGPEGIRKYTRRQSLLVSRVVPRRELHMMPFRRRNYRVLTALVRLLYGGSRS